MALRPEIDALYSQKPHSSRLPARNEQADRLPVWSLADAWLVAPNGTKFFDRSPWADEFVTRCHVIFKPSFFVR
jgi:hypothetical protein